MDWLAFSDELEKISWGGTYYHGTSPQNEESILREGLKADRGGTGAVALASGAMGSDNPIIQRFQKNTKGKVTMSRSKTLAKVYGAFQYGGLSHSVGQTSNAIHSAPSLMGRLRAVGAGAVDLGKTIANHQPLEIAGKALKGLHMDPDHRLLAVQSASDIPAALIRKSRASKIGNLVRKALHF